jgi:hypothetical protein
MFTTWASWIHSVPWHRKFLWFILILWSHLRVCHSCSLFLIDFLTKIPYDSIISWWLFLYQNFLTIMQTCNPWRMCLSRLYCLTSQSGGRRDSSVGIDTDCRLDDRGVGVRVSVRSRIFSSSRHPDRLWGPPNLLCCHATRLYVAVRPGRNP